MLTGSDVEVPPLPIVAVTPDPANVTAVAPFRLVPVMVADAVVPCTPPSGEIDVIVGHPVEHVTVNPLNTTDVAAAVVTVSVRVPVAAPDAMVIVTGRLVAVP